MKVIVLNDDQIKCLRDGESDVVEGVIDDMLQDNEVSMKWFGMIDKFVEELCDRLISEDEESKNAEDELKFNKNIVRIWKVGYKNGIPFDTMEDYTNDIHSFGNDDFLDDTEEQILKDIKLCIESSRRD